GSVGGGELVGGVERLVADVVAVAGEDRPAVAMGGVQGLTGEGNGGGVLAGDTPQRLDQRGEVVDLEHQERYRGAAVRGDEDEHRAAVDIDSGKRGEHRAEAGEGHAGLLAGLAEPV